MKINKNSKKSCGLQYEKLKINCGSQYKKSKIIKKITKYEELTDCLNIIINEVKQSMENKVKQNTDKYISELVELIKLIRNQVSENERKHLN